MGTNTGFIARYRWLMLMATANGIPFAIFLYIALDPENTQTNATPSGCAIAGCVTTVLCGLIGCTWLNEKLRDGEDYASAYQSIKMGGFYYGGALITTAVDELTAHQEYYATFLRTKDVHHQIHAALHKALHERAVMQLVNFLDRASADPCAIVDRIPPVLFEVITHAAGESSETTGQEWRRAFEHRKRHMNHSAHSSSPPSPRHTSHRRAAPDVDMTLRT